ncbi:MAG: helix-turn-helix domain-containing protein [Methanimicrococcus sp.]|nr:helix-turn-helix domain-containing protein [Methanimicrococcus sp.]
MDTTGTLPPKEEEVHEKQANGESVEEFDASSLVIIPVNDESKKIRQIFSNETSMKILEILKKESLSSSQLAERLDIPLTTVKYNLDILVENNLVNIKRIKYSEKGRQVKIYEAPEKVIVFAPESMSRFSLVNMLQKYAVALGAVGLLGIIFNSLYLRYTLSRQVNVLAGRGMDIEENIAVSTAAPFPDSSGPAEPDPIPVDDSSLVLTPADPVPVDPSPALPADPSPAIPPADSVISTDAGITEISDPLQNFAVTFSDWIFSMLTHYYVWFILGALFTCALIWIIEYVSVKRKD